MKLHLAPLALALAFGSAAALAKEYTAAPPQKNAPPLEQRFADIDKAKYAAPAWKGKIAADIADKKHSMRTKMPTASISPGATSFFPSAAAPHALALR